MNKPTLDQIQDRIQALVAELTSIVRDGILEQAAERRGERRGARRARGEAPAPTPRGRSRARAAKATRPASAGRDGVKRTSDELERLQDSLLEVIELNPGQRIDALGALLKLPTRTLALPMKRLIASRRVRASGQRRATTYTAR